MGSVFAAVQDAANRVKQSVPPLGLSIYGHLVTLLDFYQEIALWGELVDRRKR